MAEAIKSVLKYALSLRERVGRGLTHQQMIKFSIFLFSIFSYCQVRAQLPVVSNIQCQYQQYPLGVEDASPRLGWQIKSSRRNVMQSAYRILVADDKALLHQGIGNIWDSKKVISNNQSRWCIKGKNFNPERNIIGK